MALTPEETAAAARIAQYNNGPYNATTNPYGFGDGGHLILFDQALADAVLMAEAAAREANTSVTARLNRRGAWSSATAYAVNDVVRYQGSAWVAIQAGTNHTPPSLPTTSDSWWELLVEKGDAGEDGAPGFNPRGAWDSGTTYAKGDGARGPDATWVSLQDGNTNHALPVLPTTSNEWWLLFAQDGPPGESGEGTGSVNPSGGPFVVGRPVLAGNTSGTSITPGPELGALATKSAVADGDFTGQLSVAKGGTGAATDAGARTNLGIKSMALRDVTISTSDPSGGVDGDVWLKVPA